MWRESRAGAVGREPWRVDVLGWREDGLVWRENEDTPSENGPGAREN